MEALALRREIVTADIERVYEALFLNAVAAFEAFLEDLFVGLLVNGTGLVSGGGVRPRIMLNSHKVARDVVLAGRSFADWLPYDQTTRRARVFFVGGRPFEDLSATHTTNLTACGAIRNAIAHRSSHARRVFKSQVIGALPLAPRERRPAGYLRSVVAAFPAERRYEAHIAQLLGTARFLTPR